MTSYQVPENYQDHLVVRDPLLGSIYCTTDRAMDDHRQLRSWGIVVETAVLIDVRYHTAPFPESSTVRPDKFIHDSYVEQYKFQKFCLMLIDYACWIYLCLSQKKQVVLCCSNGRSRSPCVIRAFFLLRGLDLNGVKPE